MPAILKEFAFPEKKSASRYPWETWSDTKIRRLTHGEDFKCQPRTLAMMARKVASQRSLGVRVAVEEKSVVLQFYQSNEPPKPVKVHQGAEKKSK